MNDPSNFVGSPVETRIDFRRGFGYASPKSNAKREEGCMIVFEHHRQCGPVQALRHKLQG